MRVHKLRLAKLLKMCFSGRKAEKSCRVVLETPIVNKPTHRQASWLDVVA